MLNLFQHLIYICLHSFSVFPIGNTPFVHIVYSSTTHVNGYSFRFDISYGNISFVLRTHRVCKENHSCLRELQLTVFLFPPVTAR